VGEFSARILLRDSRVIELHGPADITKEKTDAIVNAANSSLLGGGGVDGAIHDAGGAAILRECQKIVDQIGRLPAGRAALTSGGNLPAKYVIHTVGPVFYGGERGEAETLASCYRESIKLAEAHKLQSISFPSISTGAFRYPIHSAAQVALAAAVEALNSAVNLKKLRFVLFDARTLNAYISAAEDLCRNQTLSLLLEKGS